MPRGSWCCWLGDHTWRTSVIGHHLPSVAAAIGICPCQPCPQAIVSNGSLWDNASSFCSRFQKILFSSNKYYTHTHTPATQKMENKRNSYSHSISLFPLFMTQNYRQSSSHNWPKIIKGMMYFEWCIISFQQNPIEKDHQSEFRYDLLFSPFLSGVVIFIKYFLFTVKCVICSTVISHVTLETIPLSR